MSHLRRRDLPSLLGAGFYQSSRALAARNAPNIVLITGDHLRWNHVALNGNPAIHTPRMDSLATSGVTFTTCCTVGVACAPNRASLMTGRYPNAHRLMVNGIKMPEDEVTLTHVLRGAGYSLCRSRIISATGRFSSRAIRRRGRFPRARFAKRPAVTLVWRKPDSLVQNFGAHVMRVSDERHAHPGTDRLILPANPPDVAAGSEAEYECPRDGHD